MELTPTGLVLDTVDEIVTDISTTLKDTISPNLDTNPETSVLGQIIGILAEREYQNQQVLRELYAAGSPSGASGQALTQLALITGTVREDATRSTVIATLNLDGGAFVPIGSRANVAGSPNVQFETTEDIENTGGSPANFDTEMRAIDVGTMRAPSGTLTEITTPVVGWNTVTNAADAEVGAIDESDPILRARREAELRIQGSAALDAIAADVSEVSGVVSVAKRENTADTAVDVLPPHSFQIVVWDGVSPAADDDDIAQAIWDAKPAGILSYGLESGTATDRQGDARVVAFSRAEQVEVYLEIDITVDPDTFPGGGDALIEASVVADATRRWTVGADVIPSALYGAVFTQTTTNLDGTTVTPIPGVVSVSAIRQHIGTPPGATTNRTIAFDEIALADTGRVLVTHV